MALVAINAVKHVAAYATVPRVRRRGGMASGALKNRIVTGIGVAGRTDTLGVAVANGKPGVIERRSGPNRSCVARITGRREPGGRVVGIVGPLVVHLVTGITVGRKSGVVVVHVTTRAGRAGVRAAQRKPRVVMIKRTLGPNHGVVAHLAVGRKTQLNMIDRRQGIVEIGLVARHAGGAPQTVIVTDVAGSAGRAYVRASQGKAGRGVVEGRPRPRGGRMAYRTVGGKCRRHVAGIGGALEIALMTSDTRRVRQLEVVIDVAGSAGHAHVRPGQRKPGEVVVKGGVGPGCGRMARLAIRGKATEHVIGIRSALEIRHVTGGASGTCGRQIEVVIHMAGSAGHAHVRAGQRKSRGAMVKVGHQPGIDPVAGLAIGGKAGRHVIRRQRVLEIPHVAGIALRRKPGELSAGPVLMAPDAIHRGMGADEREAIFVSAYRLQRHIPADHAVALLATGAKLPAMNIGVTVRAPRAYVAEYQLGMALGAIHLGVHAAQGIAGLVMVELRNRADRFPARLCMAILAGDG